MSILLQTPDVASAMTDGLQLYGAGSFSMEVDTTIVPVCIVSDVSNRRDESRRDWVGRCETIAGAITVPRFGFRWVTIATPLIERIEIRTITLTSTIATTWLIGWGTILPAGGSFSANAKDYRPSSGGVPAPNGNVVLASDTGGTGTAAEYGYQRSVAAAETATLDFSECPWVIRAPSIGATPGLVIIGTNSAGGTSHCSIEWREILRG